MVATPVLLLTRSTTTLPDGGAADRTTVKVAVSFSPTVTLVGLTTIEATSLLIMVTGIIISGKSSKGSNERASSTANITLSVSSPRYTFSIACRVIT
ncbi:MAG: hypothetical protein BWY89_00295 [Bacteroidetes bacterium ADurb.BinA012]|nr:MAG: hypothetical protein BWY89_00295 [Bacteroidetes bacterium ADurb.BinA012]